MKPGEVTPSGGDKYDPVPCPNGLPGYCSAMNVWGKAWEDWGIQVKNILDSLGTPTGVSPPPPPPFK
jgi:hypothetical protein